MRIRRLCAWSSNVRLARWIRKHKFGCWKQITQLAMKLRFEDEHKWRQGGKGYQR
ncbi:BgTH12-01778 [Blumeria graminis f. sp. triticale]|uniref:BgTH12-01768 n=1 Tax=Blumeria graminis f. sp. triticale TaxID=1689686 RepID=A0A9W4DGV3_BLUGR|nr:BgTH12-01768 [Blumeria graminis f. sp. triticale]CAD6501524.1 BgTH12-01776 [Blumeria graminis f. sp. triticale]CAD6501526.1 BgTH12-01778 [Blumeria graminis f. sp. triticale]